LGLAPGARVPLDKPPGGSASMSATAGKPVGKPPDNRHAPSGTAGKPVGKPPGASASASATGKPVASVGVGAVRHPPVDRFRGRVRLAAVRTSARAASRTGKRLFPAGPAPSMSSMAATMTSGLALSLARPLALVIALRSASSALGAAPYGSNLPAVRRA
jgi:hypothetical protein